MTIDERLERLTERHEALTQSIELLTLDVRELSSVFKQSLPPSMMDSATW